MNGTKSALRLFLPTQCLSLNSGLLLGYQDLENKACCITGIHGIHEDVDPGTIREITANAKLSVVGLWQNFLCDTQSAKVTELSCKASVESANGWLILKKTDEDLPQCYLQQAWKTMPDASSKVILVLYDSAVLARSEYLLECCRLQQSSAEQQNGCLQSSNIAFLLSSFLQAREIETEKTSLQVEDFTRVNNGIVKKCDSMLHSGISWVLSVVFGMLLKLFQTRFFNNRVSRLLGTLPITVLQLQKKFTDLAHLRSSSEEPISLRARSRLWTHILDCCLGVALMYWLLQGGITELLGEALIMWAHNVVSELQQLLQWLMGVPAGLKLNSQLDRFLGKFFLYHVYLWTGYLQLLKPVLSDLLWYISLTGCLGLSVQLSLLQDLVSMMTLHIYCFYVYAARLYSLQLLCLSSLWRLFRGKKWNVLRKRVDSALFDVDQLFIGTLLFTILLFLLPTIALYYVVFMGLRVLILSIQGVLYKAVSTLNSVPIYAVYLRLLHSQSVTDDVQFHVIQTTPQSDKPLCLALQFTPASLLKLWTDFGERQLSVKYTWSEFAHMLMSGHLVYPWIEKTESKDKTD